MAKDDDDDEEEEGGRSKLPMIIGGVVVLGAVYNFVLRPSPAPEEGAEEAPPAEVAMVDPIEGEIYELPEMVVNIDDPEVTYVRFAAALILEEGVLAADFEAESAIARDVVLDIISSKSADDLRGEKKQETKEEISVKVREAYGDAKVVRALITTLVMQ